MQQRVYKTYDQARRNFQRADLLLKRPTSLWGRMICTAGLSEYSHAEMLATRNDCGWVALGVQEKRGGSSRPMEKVIADEQPGMWDHYRVRTDRFPEFNREAAEERMWKFDDCTYGWWELRKASLIYLPVVRLFQKTELLCVDNGDTIGVEQGGNSAKPFPPFCSMAYAIAANEGGGVDPVKNLRHSMTTPGHLAQSHLFEYACTLVPEGFVNERAAA